MYCRSYEHKNILDLAGKREVGCAISALATAMMHLVEVQLSRSG